MPGDGLWGTGGTVLFIQTLTQVEREELSLLFLQLDEKDRSPVPSRPRIQSFAFVVQKIIQPRKYTLDNIQILL